MLFVLDEKEIIIKVNDKFSTGSESVKNRLSNKFKKALVLVCAKSQETDYVNWFGASEREEFLCF